MTQYQTRRKGRDEFVRLPASALAVSLLFPVLMLAAAGCGPARNGSMRLSGTLEMTEHSIGARVPGIVTTLNVDEGSAVKKGDLIATLDRYEQTKKDYERALQLKKDNYAIGDREVEQYELDFNDQQIRSPIDGVVLEKTRELGEVVQPGGPIVVIGNPADLWVRIYVPEGKVGCIQMKQPATIHFDGIPAPYKGRISFIATDAEFTPRNIQTPEERVTRTFSVKIAVEEPSAQLHSGMSATVELPYAC